MAASEAWSGPIRWPRLFAVLVLGFLLLELAAQLFILSYAGKRFISLSVNRWSPYGLVRNNPALTSPGFAINSSGFRAVREYDRRKPEGVFRVILLGGSALYSGIVPGAARLDHYGRVSSDQTIASYLQRRMEADTAFAGRKIEVINAAVNFNRIVEVSASYLQEYLHWQPDLVIVYGGINNFGTFRVKGEVTGERSPLITDHSWRPEFERLVNDPGLAAFLERTWRTGAENSALLALLQKAMVTMADRSVAVIGRLYVRRATAPAAPEEPESDAERAVHMRIYESYADAMIAAARRAGQQIAFAWEPLLGTLDGVKPFSDEERSLFGRLPAFRRDPALAIQFETTRRDFNAYLASVGVPAIDPTEALRRHRDTVFIDYGHYTASGNDFLAMVALDRLRPLLLELTARN